MTLLKGNYITYIAILYKENQRNYAMIIGKTLRKRLKITANSPQPKTLGKTLAKYDEKHNKVPEEGNELAYLKIRLCRCGLTKEEMIGVFWAYKEALGRLIIPREEKRGKKED